jgi:diguanylate cyclase (GGDEF)-like protein/PAS domain S-box-containing protein
VPDTHESTDALGRGAVVRAFGRVGFPVALAMLAGVAVLSYVRLQEFRGDIEWRGHTHVVLEHIERAQTALLGADSFRHAYRLSHDRSDRDEMETRVASSARELADVGALTQDNPRQQERLRALRPIVAERLEVLHDGLELPSWDQLDAKTRDDQRARQSHGADLAKRVSAQIDSMRDEELRLLDERDRQMTLSAGATQRTLLYGSATGTALVALFYGSLVFENRRRLRAQQSLAQTNALFDAVMNGTTDVIAVKDTAGRYLLINPAGCRNLGRTREDVLGKTDLDVLTGGSGASVMANDAEVLRGGETRTYEQVASVGDRTWTFLSTKAPYKGPEGNVLGIIAVSRDISERKALEDRVAQQNVERGESIKRLQRHSEELAALSEMARLLQSTYVATEIYELIGHFATRLFGCPGGFGVTASSRTRVDQVAHWGAGQAEASFQPTDCWALRSGRPHSSNTGGTSCRHVAPERGPTLCAPLIARGETLGVLQLHGEPPTGPREQLLGAFTEQLSLAIANLQLRETLRSQAIRDPLTNLFNRRYMDETLLRELSRVKRKDAPLAVIMIDIDHFKRLNDTAGHAAGDEILKLVAQQLANAVRREDVACRYGGEEFALILPEMTLEGAVDRAEKLRREIEGVSAEVGGLRVGPVTASFGVACFPAHGSSGEALFRAADKALYEAKSGGRNRVVQATVLGLVDARRASIPPPSARRLGG